MAREELSVVEDIQDSSYRRTVTGHRRLVDIRRFPATAIVEDIPLGFGDVSMVYRSFIVCMS